MNNVMMRLIMLAKLLRVVHVIHRLILFEVTGLPRYLLEYLGRYK